MNLRLRPPARVVLGTGLLALLTLVAGCGGSSSTTSAPSAPASSASASASSAVPSYGRYVALGDSYTAAPYVYLTDIAGGCLRSDGNYPALLAKQIGATLRDVSCSGADTTDLVDAQQTFQGSSVPAQLSAVTATTKLVTVGIGGNDFGLFASLTRGCPVTGPGGQAFGGASPKAATTCGRVDRAAADRTVARIGDNVRSSLAAIRSKAPQAKVVLVGYPRIASTTTTCPKLLPATLADARAVDAVTHELSTTMAAAAKTSGVTFVDMYAASVGHDVCAGKQAWVNGVATDPQRAAPLHPFAVEQRAVALAIAEALA